MMTDMTKGSPFKILLKFVLPMLLSMVFQQMYNLADSVIAGRYLGVDALAATGAAYPITVLFLAVATGASLGSSVVISQLFGAHDHVRMRAAVNTAVITLITLSLVLTVAGQIACPALMSFINTPKDIFEPTMVYLRIYIAGLLFLFLYNTATAIFNGLGDSRTPLYFLAFSTTFNVILDVLFVTTFDMGIAGVGWATLIAQGLSSILAILTLVRRLSRIKTERKPARFDTHLLRRMSLIAIPSICQQSFVSIGVFFVQGLVNSLGPFTVAGFSAALKVSTFALMVMNSLPNALSSYAAQNIGAQDIPRVRQGIRACVLMSEIIICSIIALFFFAGDQILGLFMGSDANGSVINIGVQYLLIVAPFYPLIGVKNCCDSVLRGGGAMGPFMVTTLADLVLRVVLAYALMPICGFAGICYAYPLGWIIGTSISIIFYISNIWIPKYMRQAKQQGFVLHPICRAEEEQKQQTHRLHLPFAVRH
ncbi:MATE family efflux transporter [Butyricicoccus porcorum]|uniref:MATE family efflux transporter n=1 Tax=Butyricicoccus porcorum TaxID=1945634 RepID=UPI003F4AB26A